MNIKIDQLIVSLHIQSAPGTIIACPYYFVTFIESLLLWPLGKEADAALFEVLSLHLLKGLWKISGSQVPGP